MSAFTPSALAIVAILAAGLAACVAIGFLITRIERLPLARGCAWMLVILAIVFAERATAAEPAGVRMLAICGYLLFSMKSVVAVEGLSARGQRLSLTRWVAFAALWPGMRPALFLDAGGPPREGWRALVLRGLFRVAIGAGLLGLARVAWVTTASRWLATAPLLVGLSLVLHFGVFNVLAGGWRALGVNAEPLFKAPLLATSLGEFWSRRWNLAFSEMTAIGVYRPISGLVGRKVGVAVGFLCSGVLHELAISLPVRAGFGLPMLYFALHGTLVLIERALEKRGMRIDSRRSVGHVWTLVWLAAPMPILFHPPFLRGVVWPIIGIDG